MGLKNFFCFLTHRWQLFGCSTFPQMALSMEILSTLRLPLSKSSIHNNDSHIGPTSSTLIDHLYTNDVTISVVSGVWLSRLSQFNKFFEKLLYSRIYFYLVRYNMLSDCQFGLRKNCSTVFAINKIYNDLLNNIDQNVYTCCIFLDLSKAFDTVNRSILLQKLEKMYGFCGSALSLMKSYLINSYQYTKTCNS